MARVIQYVFLEDATLSCIHLEIDERFYALTSSDTLWAWDSCDWRQATDDENQWYLAEMMAARDKAPRLQQVFMPVVSN